MVWHMVRSPRYPHYSILLGSVLAVVLGMGWPLAQGQQTKLDVLRIGTTGSLVSPKASKEQAAVETLQNFIKDEIGLNNVILRQKNWQELTEKMTKGELQVAVFQGYEFAWAQARQAGLKPLALAVNVYRYPVAYVVAPQTNPAKDFAGLQGQSLSLPPDGQGFLRLFVEHECQAQGKKLDAFFGKIVPQENVEDALDDAVDGNVQAVAADRAALEAYKRRKPGRFKQLKEIAHSQPFPPPVVAYYSNVLDQATLRRFEDGLLNANRKERGQTMLTLFHLTSFETVPSDFGQVLAATLKTYPPPSAQGR